MKEHTQSSRVVVVLLCSKDFVLPDVSQVFVDTIVVARERQITVATHNRIQVRLSWLLWEKNIKQNNDTIRTTKIKRDAARGRTFNAPVCRSSKRVSFSVKLIVRSMLLSLLPLRSSPARDGDLIRCCSMLIVRLLLLFMLFDGMKFVDDEFVLLLLLLPLLLF